MTALNETVYPQLLPEPKPRELSDHYTPTDAELAWARRNATTPLKRVGLLILLKCAQRLGRCPLIREVPRPYLDHITRAGGLVRNLRRDELQPFDQGQNRQNYVDQVRKRMGIRRLDDEAWLLQRAQEAAQTQHHVSDIVNVLVEELIHHCYELPGFSTLVRVAVKARDLVEEAHYAAIAAPLSADTREKIDKLFTISGSGTSAWNDLKQEPAKPTSTAVREYLDHVRSLQKLAAGLPPLNMIPVTKLTHYQLLARSERANEMRELKPNKRYALAVIYIKSCLSRALDDAGDLYVRMYGKMQAAATRQLREYQVERSMEVEALLARFRETLVAYQVEGDLKQRMHAIDVAVRNEAAKLIALCDEHLGFSNNNSLPFLLQQYDYTDQGFVDPTKDPLVRQVLRVIRATDPAIEKRARPLQLELLQAIDRWLEREIAATGSRLQRGAVLRLKRDRALLLLAFWRGFRGDELLAMLVENVDLRPGVGLTWSLSRTKTNQHQGTNFSMPALSRLCPVTAYEAWATAAGLADGPVFRSIDRWGHLGPDGLHPNSLIPLLRRLFRQAGVPEPEGFSAHSLRRGFANWATDNGWDLKSLMEHVGWRDVKSAMRYVDSSQEAARLRIERSLGALPLASVRPPPALPAPSTAEKLD
ncbi:MAG TPA: DUF4158 domain-containing protein [Nevskia sp.]|nr:DUF4158 domain-containing protein [Nevskia sp.]